jgi:hypothetical protein
MTPAEEAGLRAAIAEREQRLAKMLMDPRATRQECDQVRHAIERLRRELGSKA